MPEKDIAIIEAEWNQAHGGPGHVPSNAKFCAQARAREERKAMRGSRRKQ